MNFSSSMIVMRGGRSDVTNLHHLNGTSTSNLGPVFSKLDKGRTDMLGWLQRNLYLSHLKRGSSRDTYFFSLEDVTDGFWLISVVRTLDKAYSRSWTMALFYALLQLVHYSCSSFAELGAHLVILKSYKYSFISQSLSMHNKTPISQRFKTSREWSRVLKP